MWRCITVSLALCAAPAFAQPPPDESVPPASDALAPPAPSTDALAPPAPSIDGERSSLTPADGEPPLPPGLRAEDGEAEPGLPAGIEAFDSDDGKGKGDSGDGNGPGTDDPEPGLPTGIGAFDPPAGSAEEGGADDEPGLPTGIGDFAGPGQDDSGGQAHQDGDDGEPGLPIGIDGPATKARPDPSSVEPPFELRGFVDVRAGRRLTEDPLQSRASLGEARLQLEAERQFEVAELTLHAVADLVIDPVLDVHPIDLELGEGLVDLREASVALAPIDSLDIEVGRQILGWGTGDLLFINDLFPKDWNAFFIGRDVSYLKAPSDAAKVAFFHDAINVDLVYTPRFDSDRVPDRRRLSSWDPLLVRLAGRDVVRPFERPERWFRDAEWALRVHRRVAGIELAAYGYHGFWKSPSGFDPRAGAWLHPRLRVYGLSGRSPVAGGIGSAEVGFYDSADDRAGSDPLLFNSEVRSLLAYERELVTDLTGSVQYFARYMLDHDQYRAGLAGAPGESRVRHLFTVRLTWLHLDQTLQSTAFLAYSPSDGDFYLRARTQYQLDDHWRLEAGINVLRGDAHTFLGQFADASNLYLGGRIAW